MEVLPGTDRLLFWYRVSNHEKELIQTDNQIRGEYEGDSRYSGLLYYPDFARSALPIESVSTLLPDTLRSYGITGGLLKIDLEGLQMGTLGFHYKVTVLPKEGEPLTFVTYVSRAPDGHEFGGFSRRDFEGLRLLSQKLNTRFGNHAPVSVVRPLADAQVEYNKNTYYCFTTEFVPFGELHFDSELLATDPQDHSEIWVSLPRYAIPYTDEMSNVNASQARLLRRLHVVNAKNLRANFAERKQALSESDAWQIIKNQQEQMVIAAALLYEGSDHFFPTYFAPNAGDFMCRFERYNLLDFHLITARGGVRQISENDWVNQILSSYNAGSYDEGPTFPQLKPQDVVDCLSQAKILLP